MATYPEAVAIDWLQLFSRIEKSRAIPLAERARKSAKARITEVRPTPSAKPVFAPMYKPVADKTPPRTNPVNADRRVSCGMSAR